MTMFDQLENISKEIESIKMNQMEILELKSKMPWRSTTVDVN